MTPTVEQFLTKLAANKSEAIAFDACRPDLTRRQHCELVLSKLKASCSAVDHSKKLADQRKINAKLKSDIAIAKAALAAKKTAPSAPAPKSRLSSTGLAKASNFFAAQARK